MIPAIAPSTILFSGVKSVFGVCFGAHLSSQRWDSQHLIDFLQTLKVLQHRAQLVEESALVWLPLGPRAAAPHPVWLRNAVRWPGRTSASLSYWLHVSLILNGVRSYLLWFP